MTSRHPVLVSGGIQRQNRRHAAFRRSAVPLCWSRECAVPVLPLGCRRSENLTNAVYGVLQAADRIRSCELGGKVRTGWELRSCDSELNGILRNKRLRGLRSGNYCTPDDALSDTVNTIPCRALPQPQAHITAQQWSFHPHHSS